MQKLNVCVQTVYAQVEAVCAKSAVRRCAAAPRLLAPACAALALLLPALSARADAPDFRCRSPQLESSDRRKRMSHTEFRRHGGKTMARGDAPSGAMRGGVAWG